MKRIFFTTLTAALLFCACNSGTSAQQKVNDDTATRDSIIQRVTDIYTAVCKAYPSDHGFDANGDFYELNLPNLDSLYCTRGWNELLAKVAEKDEQSGDEMPFFDFDYWIMGQDWDNVHFDKVVVTELNGDTATVNLDWYNFDNCTTIPLVLLREDGEWRIDDIDGLKQGMQVYVESDF